MLENDYAGEPCAAAERPYLARIGELADEAARIAGYLDAFLARCRGGVSGEAKSGPTPVPSGHLGQLDRLTDNLARVDKFARELQKIG